MNNIHKKDRKLLQIGNFKEYKLIIKIYFVNIQSFYLILIIFKIIYIYICMYI